MLFRPEEVHRASGIRRVFKPLPKGHCYIGHQTLRLSSENLPIADLDTDRKSAIETGSIDLDYFPGKEPADC
jgi:hypothetical protein